MKLSPCAKSPASLDRSFSLAAQTVFQCVIVLIGFLILSGCAPSESTPVFPPFNLVTLDPNASPTATPFQPEPPRAVVSITSEIPTEEPDLIPTVTSTIQPTSIPPTPPFPAPLEGGATQPLPVNPGRNNYILYATLDFPNRTLAVDETIRYYNLTGSPLHDLVLSVQPNRYGNCFSLISLARDGVALDSYELNGQRLTINLDQSLQAGAATTLTVSFELDLPAKRPDGLFGYDFNQVNLVDWYPFVVPYDNGWLLHDPLSFCEHLVYDASDIELNLKTGDQVVVAASAPGETNGSWTRYRLYGARTFALSASNEFLTSESAVGSVSIHSYFFEGYRGAGEGIRNAAVQAVGLYSVKFAPYPYESLSVVQADINDGQEYDGLVFLSTDFYGQYGGSNRSNLVTIGVHEIAHQWWFGLVGNDQAMEPWLDEAMSVYSERVFYEFTNSGNNLDWWWDFRVEFFDPGGYVDSTIYEGGAFRPYTNAVYLNGAYFMEAFRNRLGDQAFYQFVEDYAARFGRSRATGQDFFTVARQHTDEDLGDLITTYFKGSY